MPKATLKQQKVSLTTAETSFLAMKPRIDAIPSKSLAPVNVDVQVAGSFALGVAQMIAAPPIRKRFQNLAKSGEFDSSCVKDLPTAARAAWYARHMLLLIEGTRSEAQLPAPLVDEGNAVRARMAKAAEYNLGDDPNEAEELAFLRSGQGYQDLANDLVAYAAMYRRHKKVLAKDQKYYEPSDAARAKAIAEEIIARLGKGATPEQETWSLAQARSWTLLLKVYAEVQRGGLFLFAYEDGASMFPSLTTTARASASRASKTNSGPATGEPHPPAEPPK